jgi:hypothetical protein
MIDVKTAEQLLNLGARIGDGQRAQEQLEGAVALHNILKTQGVAYLADEVGMGKTYVALATLALFRHFQPDFRVMIIAPRENIQMKWMKELRNFIENNVRFSDLRVKAIDGRPARSLVSCKNLLELVHEATLDPNRDFFVRLPSFSLPVSGVDRVDPEAAKRFRDGLRHYLPWMRDEVFDLRNKQTFKDNIARAICCALPRFDLVIVDEGHNLKHGFSERVSARNRVLALAFGHPDARADSKLFPHYNSRARRVLFLSATPVEETYSQLWNQLNVFGRAEAFDGLRQQDTDEDQKKALAAQFLVRRVTRIQVDGKEHTKNLYRREWRRGGVHTHDEPIRIDSPRHRLIVALVQKKVTELLGHDRFGSSFQIGMLASFESFLETAKLKREIEGEANFDDTDQTDDTLEREGIDVGDVNRLARSYRKVFGSEMPHPKMDALVQSLSDSWRERQKALVFVRRVKSVKELKRKLDEQYDKWLLDRLRVDLPEQVHERFERLVARYRTEKSEAEDKRSDEAKGESNGRLDAELDRGGFDTFFAWFFRGDGPAGVISGANVQQRFIQRGAAYATFFEDNIVAEVLGCPPDSVEHHLAEALGVGRMALRDVIREKSKKFLTRAKRIARADRFEAVQAAAIELLSEHVGPHQKAARLAWRQRFETSLVIHHATEAPDIGNWLELKTFFTELRLRPELRRRIWPEPTEGDDERTFRERVLRSQLLAAAARLGHAFIDLYVMTIRRLKSLELRAQETFDDAKADIGTDAIGEYLDLLETQMRTPRGQREFRTFDELAEIADNYDLILDVNAPDARSQKLSETTKLFGQLLRQQQPVGGMSGQINQTLVRQFRMPGYPIVLVSTDLLQEGEDLHTFCSAVHHYGISWTPSAMEQRIGRIDRVRSQTDRRLSTLPRALEGNDKLQVYFPHLEDTVEVLQVQRVLERMNVFLRLMHEGLITSGTEERTIKTVEEYARPRRLVPQISELLRSAFPVREEHLGGKSRSLAVDDDLATKVLAHFQTIMEHDLPELEVAWEPYAQVGVYFGTAQLVRRIQPLMLQLRSVGTRLLVRCTSPVGRVGPSEMQETITATTRLREIRLGAVVTPEERTFDLTVESDVLLSGEVQTDRERIAILIRKVVENADQLEQELLPGQDQPLQLFRDDLQREVKDGS